MNTAEQSHKIKMSEKYDFDIVIPNEPAADFVKMAEKLGIKHVYLAYPLDKFLKIKNSAATLSSKKVEAKLCILAEPSNISEAARHSDFIIVKSTMNPNIDRQLFENKKVNVIFGLEESHKRDSFHHRNSGLNQVLCKLAEKNKITIGFSLDSLLSVSGMLRSRILGRIKQNKRFCFKFRTECRTFSFAKDAWGMRSVIELGAI